MMITAVVLVRGPEQFPLTGPASADPEMVARQAMISSDEVPLTRLALEHDTEAIRCMPGVAKSHETASETWSIGIRI